METNNHPTPFFMPLTLLSLIEVLASVMTLKIIKLHQIVLISAFIFMSSACGFLQPDYLKTMTASELKQVMQDKDIFLVDVHTPKQKHIKGTDLFIPYSEVEAYKDKLPKDKTAAIYLYCESGPMGNAAARTLHDLGYSNLINLEGGANAWRKVGFKFE